MRHVTKYRWVILVVLALLLVLTEQGIAKPLAPGKWVTLNGTTAAATPTLAGTVIQDRLVPFSIHDKTGQLIFKGKLQDRVVRSRRTGKLIFNHMIRDTQPGLSGAIASVKWTNFAGFKTDVDFRLDGGGSIGPTGATRSTSGDVVNFIFTIGKGDHPEWKDNPIHSGQESRFFHVMTDATKYASNGRTTIYATDGSRVTITTYAPRK